MIVNIYKKISEWMLNCPEIGGYAYFNVIPPDAGDSSVNSNSSSQTVNEFINGSKEVRLNFSVNLIREYDNGGTSDVNLDAISEFDKVIKYIEDKNSINDYPDLGNKYIVNEIGALNKAPEVYLTPDNPNIARYEGLFYINYLEI